MYYDSSYIVIKPAVYSPIRQLQKQRGFKRL